MSFLYHYADIQTHSQPDAKGFQQSMNNCNVVATEYTNNKITTTQFYHINSIINNVYFLIKIIIL